MRRAHAPGLALERLGALERVLLHLPHVRHVVGPAAAAQLAARREAGLGQQLRLAKVDAADEQHEVVAARGYPRKRVEDA